MNTRKLQGEIDKTLKKAADGIIEFDAILKKVYSAISTNQKEKYEGDLKKEIKKLQRYRDQIKVWIASNDVKNKSALLESRKSIEEILINFKKNKIKKMDDFFERDARGKGYSKDNLDAATKNEMAKDHVSDWGNKAISTLKTQMESFDSELESIPVRKRKTESTRVEALQKYISHHRYHLRALEFLIRMMEDDRISPDDIEKIKDSVECYIDSYEQEDTYEAPEEVYSFFNLKQNDLGDEDYEFSLDEDSDDENYSDTSDNDNNDDDKQDSDIEELEKSSTTTASTATSTTIPATSTTSATAPTTPTQTNSSVPTTTTPPPQSNTTSSSITKSPTLNSQQQRVGSPAPNQQTPPQQPQNKNLTSSPTFSSVTKSNIKNETSNKQPQPVTQPQFPSSIGNVPMAQRVMQHQQAQQQAAAAQQAAQQQQAVQQQQAAQQQTAPNNKNKQYNDVNDVQDQLSQLNINKSQQPQDIDDSKNNETFDSSLNIYPGSLAELSSATLSRINESNYNQQQYLYQQQQQQQGATQQQTAAQQQQYQQSQASGQQQQLSPQQQYQQQQAAAQQQYQQQSMSPPQPSLVSGQLGFEDAMMLTKHMMEVSLSNIPDLKDYERVSTYIPRNPKPVPSYYPQTPLTIFDSSNVFEKFDIDTLFFIFYFKQGSYQQYQAAKELKKQGWRYHKKYLTWFRRHEEPKEITNEYEQGTYVYFDYETGWCQRKKTEFTFEYRFLEE